MTATVPAATADRTAAPLLEITDLEVQYRLRGRATLRAVDGVSFSVAAGETVGLVGESGSGKSTIGRAVLGLTPARAGSVTFEGRPILGLRGRRRAELAKDLQVVFQDPYSSLNPALTIGAILREPLQVQGLGAREADAVVRELLGRVSLPDDAADRYPSSFSGGQRQRIAIARALSIQAKLVICDESVSALDVSTQASILGLLKRLQRELGVAYLFISHDIAVVQNVSDRVIVLYRGRVMEQGPADQVCSEPLHPYTRVLVDAAPVPHPRLQRSRREHRLTAAVPRAAGPDLATGCPFANRCPLAEEVCSTRPPVPEEVDGVVVRCHVHTPGSGHSRARGR